MELFYFIPLTKQICGDIIMTINRTKLLGNNLVGNKIVGNILRV
jgi:hypothetical protein